MKITLLTGKTYNLENAFNFPIKVVSSFKNRRLSLRICSKKREVILSLPPFCSQKRAFQFVDSHLEWIEQNLSKIPVAKEFEDHETFALFGREIRICHQPDSLSAPRLEGSTLFVGGDKCFLHRRIKDFIKQEAQKEFSERTKSLAEKINCSVKNITIKDTKSRWGSCSTLCNINYNWRIALAPEYVIDYLMAHEVSHLKHPDHSREFWRCVKTLYPGSSMGRAWLKRNGNLLYRYK